MVAVKKVVHLIASTGMYGAEKWVLALMRAMKDSDIKSCLVNLADSSSDVSAIVAGARERGLNAQDFYTGGTFNPASIFNFSKWLKKNQIDIVHGHGYKADLIGLLAGRMVGCKVMSTPHGWSKEADRKLQFYEGLDRFLFRYMDMVCPLSEDLIQSVQHAINPTKLKLILNGVDIDEVTSTPAYKKTSNEYLIGYVGQLIERKGIPTLLQAVSILVSKSEKIKLVLVGDGEVKPQLENLVAQLNLSGFVEFTGYRSDASSLMKSFDLFILPSRLEGIPRCIMEAMAASVPVIVTDIPGCRELVNHEKTGYLFRVGDSVDLAEKIQKVMENPQLAKIMADAGLSKIEEQYSNHRMAREYSTLYNRIFETDF